MERKAFLRGAALLTGGSLLLRLGGILFRSCVASRLGDAGMGLYQLIFSLFALAVTACTSGLGLAVTVSPIQGWPRARHDYVSRVMTVSPA